MKPALPRYGQLGVGDTRSRDSVARMAGPPRGAKITMLRLEKL